MAQKGGGMLPNGYQIFASARAAVVRLAVICWNRGDEPAGSINYIGNGGNSITLDYRTRDYGGEWQPMRYDVQIVRTPCNYGGYRPWFLCPNCWRRVAVLYLPGKIAACRKCYNICYSSQCEDFSSRAMRRMGKIECALGASMREFPKKPYAYALGNLRPASGVIRRGRLAIDGEDSCLNAEVGG